MPKVPDSIGIKISELGDAGVIKENDVVPINAKTDAGVAFTKATKIIDLRQTLGFENAFLSVDAGLDTTVSGDIFFVYESGAKLWVLQYQNVSGVANPVLGYDNNQVRLPTSRQIKAAAGVTEQTGMKLIPMGHGSLDTIAGQTTFENNGAIGDGIADDTAAVQATLELLKQGYTVRSKESNARYRITSQITIYAASGKLIMDRARFVTDPALMTSGYAVRVVGVPGGTYNLGSELEIRLEGPYGGSKVSKPPISPIGTLDGIGFFPDGTNTQVSTVLAKVWVEGFRDNIYIGSQSTYLLQFIQPVVGKFWRYGWNFNCNNDAGENISIFGGVTYNGLNSTGTASAIYCPGTGQYLDAYFYSHSFDYSDLVFDISTGTVNFFGCHFENNSANPYGKMTYTTSKRKPVVNIQNTFIDGGNDVATTYANQGTTAGKAIWFTLTGPCIFSLIGCPAGKYNKMANVDVVKCSGSGALIKIQGNYFDIYGNNDMVNIGDYTNPLRNYNFGTGDLTGWSSTYSTQGTIYQPTVTYDASSPIGAAAKITGTYATGGLTTLFGQKMRCSAGQTLYLATTLYWTNLSATNGGIYFGYTFYDIDGVEISHNVIGTNLSGTTGSSASPVKCSGRVMVPPGAATVHVGLRHYQTTGSIYLGPVKTFVQ